MKKRLYTTLEAGLWSNKTYLVISYKNKKYKKFVYEGDMWFIPKNVRIESGNDGTYFTRFGKIYRRIAISGNHIKVKIMSLPVNINVNRDTYETLEAAQLYIELKEKESCNSNRYTNKSECDAVCCSY